MAFLDGKSIVAVGTGLTDAIFLHEKPNGHQWVLAFFSATWGDTDLQASVDNVNWGDAMDSCDVIINHVANGFTTVPGDKYYRLNVNTYTADITVEAR